MENNVLFWETNEADKAGDHPFDIVVSSAGLSSDAKLSGNLHVKAQ